MKHPFLFGAVAYPLMELIWRRRTHPSMALAGGLSVLSIESIDKMKTSLFLKACASGAAITGIEAVCGMIWNRRYQVWDYRRMPLNWRGQICLPYTAAWTGLSALYLLASTQLHTMQKDRLH